ncbi:MAG: sugar phosphate isomerase/epimerase [Clostridia bacterium]|nr:sugar phosphate isomerase/epimerase [Clostridia bacterium]
MKISICDKGILYSYLRELGYSGLDISFNRFNERDYILNNEYTEYIKRKFEEITKAGLNVSQTHLTYYPGHLKPIGNGTYQEFEDYMLPMFIKEIELTKMMNCKVCVIHLYFEKDKLASREGNIKLISKMIPYAERNNVVIAIENIYGNDYNDVHLTTKDDLLFYIEYFKSKFLGVCLDTGHSIVLKQNPVKLFEELKEHIVALHLHTTVENVDLHAIPYTVSYCESIEWDTLYKLILSSNYSGTLNFELRPPDNLSEGAKKAYYMFAYETAKTIIDNYVQREKAYRFTTRSTEEE